MDTTWNHATVLLNEAVNALFLDGASNYPDAASGTYVDATFGRGGHSRLILSRLSESGRLIAFDRDPMAVAEAAAITDSRCGPQLRRNQDAACAVHLDVHGIAQEDSLPPLSLHWQLRNALTETLPLCAREHHQATMWVFGDGELPTCCGTQNLAVTRWH